jgi:hypothetical protein
VISLFLAQGFTDFVQFSGFGAIFISTIFYRRMAVVRREAKWMILILNS